MCIMICIRPDLSSAVLSRYANKNNKELWQSLKRVLRYLKVTTDIKLIYVKEDFKDLLRSYVGSDWSGREETDRKSTTGYLFELGALFQKQNTGSVRSCKRGTLVKIVSNEY